MSFKVKKRLVEEGKSQVFKNWHEFTGISEEDFLQGLEWVCSDPMPGGKLTRELGIEKDGTLVRLKRVYFRDGEFNGFYDPRNNLRWSGTVSISKADRI